MKRLLLTILSVLAFAGMSVAQDVYSSGYYTSGGEKYAAVYKNNTKLYEFHVNGYNYEGTDVIRFNGDTYWSFNCPSNNNNWAAVFKNGTRFLDVDISSTGNLKMNALCHGTNYVFTAGCTPSGSAKHACVWRGSEVTPLAIINSGSYESEALCCDYGNNYLYFAGYQYSSFSSYAGKVWREYGTEVYSHDNVYIRGICVYEGNIYYAGTTGSGGLTKVYRNGYEIYSFSGWGNDIYVDAGDVYVVGSSTSTESDVKVWKNGESLYSKSGTGCYSVVANSEGVYYAGSTSTGGKVWKNNSELLAPPPCTKVRGIYVDEPECDNEIFSLPFTDGFENGNTHWPCWTVVTNGTVSTGDYYPLWDRFGQCDYGVPTTHSATGDYSVIHGYSSNNHTDWLISPKLYLQPGRDNTTLTFKCYRTATATSNPTLWISTTDASTSSFTQLSSVNWGAANSWQTVTVNLNSYQGQAVYIAFKYAGTGSTAGLCWLDDFNVTESWSPCTTMSVPYSYDFSEWDPTSSCWYVVDYDMSGEGRNWKYNSTEQCAYHPWGQNGVSQYGCLVSPNITLTAGHDYVLRFKTKSTSSGSNMANKIYIKLDGTGTPNPNYYTTLLWSDNQFANSWTDVELPLSSYAGHTISFSFEYSGTYAHNWYIKDVRVEESIAEYTITANANNNAWGTVSGGGTYNAGATCTLTATPASGYQFESWKKNGSVVSTNPSYSFTVTENATYTAYFAETPVNYYTITTNVTPSGAGTVTGGGTYTEGSTITLTATANAGYTFSQWQDGNTQNPRTITVTANATYTATFTQDNYVITVNANPTNGGTVTGGGTFHYGDTPTLTATPASNFEFAGWQDGNTDNPRQITVTGNATYTAIFSEQGAVYYTITTNVDPVEAGTVSGGGTYEEGTVVTLAATANPGYTFDHWNDGSTQNPRTITVSNNMSFTAYFNHNSYTIMVVANPSNAGTVSGGGAYYYGDHATLTATAYSGYDFVGWSDGSNENPHQVLVTGNATYTATFSQGSATYYTVSAYVSPAGSGTVTGTGTYQAGATCTLTATANVGYSFEHWNDGSTQNPRTVTVNNNMSFTAYFTAGQYTITVNAIPEEGGTVTGGGTYDYGSLVTLTAAPASGYQFMQWSDGVQRITRVVTVTGDATYSALFTDGSSEMYTLTVEPNLPELGQTSGSGTYPAGASVEISAYPSANARFVKWDDGNTQNPRTVVVNSDKTYIAEFAQAQEYTIEVISADPNRGQAYGSGTFMEGDVIEISAVAFEGYVFEKWDDGNTQNPRSITVTGNATYKAIFVESSVTTYTVTLICNTDEGTVSGGGVYVAGSTAYLTAFPHNGYEFDKWSDGATDNPRTVIVNSDLTLAAFFKGTGVGEDGLTPMTLYPNPAKGSIRISGIEANTTVEIYNSLGELVRTVNAGPDQEIGVSDLASGLYLVRCGNRTLRFVKEL